MAVPSLPRRAALLTPLLLFACAEKPREYYAPLRFSYLPPIRLNVANIEVEQRFLPSGIAPDVSLQDPVQPIEALKALARDRLQAFGSVGRAVYVIENASLTKQGDAIDGAFLVRIEVYNANNVRAGFAEARVARRHTGRIEDLQKTLYDLTRAMMDDMNIELEFQIRRNLRDWVTTATAAPMPVEQAPLELPPGAAAQPPSIMGQPPINQAPIQLPPPQPRMEAPAMEPGMGMPSSRSF